MISAAISDRSGCRGILCLPTYKSEPGGRASCPGWHEEPENGVSMVMKKGTVWPSIAAMALLLAPVEPGRCVAQAPVAATVPTNSATASRPLVSPSGKPANSRLPEKLDRASADLPPSSVSPAIERFVRQNARGLPRSLPAPATAPVVSRLVQPTGRQVPARLPQPLSPTSRAPVRDFSPPFSSLEFDFRMKPAPSSRPTFAFRSTSRRPCGSLTPGR